MSKLIRLLALCMLMAAVSGTGCNCAPSYAAAPAPATYAAPAPAPVYRAPAPAPVYAAPAPAPAPATYEADDYVAPSNYYYNTNFNPIYSMNGGRGSGGGKKANRPGFLGLIPGKQDNNGIKTNFKTSYTKNGAYTSEYSACLSNDLNKNKGVNLVAILNGCGAGLGRR